MQNSKIEWTDHTFNPWWGCLKVSPGCANCYAETWAKRYGHAVWGPATTTPRRMFGDTHWNEPLKWNKQAIAEGVRKRVFCSSMADVFEDHPQLPPMRERLWELIDQTPQLDWLLLTKRPANMVPMTPRSWTMYGWPENIIALTSVEDQQRADARIVELLKVPAKRRGLSCEPLLGPLDLRRYLGIAADYSNCGSEHLELHGWAYDSYSGGFMGPGAGDSCYDPQPGIHWIIAGGESGSGARPPHPDWFRSLRDQAIQAEVAFHFKQWGEFVPANGDARGRFAPYVGGDDPDGRTPIALPNGTLTDLEWNGGPGPHLRGGVQMLRLGKRAAGRLLDGRTWDEYPTRDEVAR